MSEFRINKICDKLEEAESENEEVLRKVTRARFSVPDLEVQDYYDNIQSDLEISLKQLVRIRWILFRHAYLNDGRLSYYEKEVDDILDYIDDLKKKEKVLLN